MIWKVIKGLIYFVLVLILLIIIAVIALVNLINPNDYKNNIEQAFLKNTNRTLVISGDIHWKIFPSLGFNLGAVSIQNPVGYPTDKSFIKIDSASLWLDPLALFQKKIEINTLSISGLSVDLIQHSEIANNWTFESVSNSGSGSKPQISQIHVHPKENKENKDNSNTQASPEIPMEISVDNLVIKNAQINFEGIAPSQNWSITGFNFTGNHLALGQAFPVVLNLIFNKPAAPNVSNIPNSQAMSLTINLQAQADIKLTQDNFDLQNLNAKINHSNLTGHLVIQDFNAPHIQGSWMLDQIDIADYANLHGAQLLLGATTLNFNLHLAGLEPSQVPSTLNGTIHADIANLVLKGIDLGSMLNAVSHVTHGLIEGTPIGDAFNGLKKALPDFSKSGEDRQINPNNGQETDLGHFVYEAQVKNGVIQNNNLDLMGPTLQAKGSGTIDLNLETVDYQIFAFLMPEDPNNLIIKILIQGPFSDIHAGVDMTDLFNQLQKKIVKTLTSPAELVKSVPVQKTIDSLANSLKNLMGGDD